MKNSNTFKDCFEDIKYLNNQLLTDSYVLFNLYLKISAKEMKH